MNEPVTRASIFFRSLWDCMSSTWNETDSYYHIPKSRFKGGKIPEPKRQIYQGGLQKNLRREHSRGFRNCIKSAWEASDSHYHIPKSRHGRVL